MTDPVFLYLFAAAAIVMTILFIFCKSMYDDQKWEMGQLKRELNDARITLEFYSRHKARQSEYQRPQSPSLFCHEDHLGEIYLTTREVIGRYPQTRVKFVLYDRDWCELQKTPHWEAVEEILQGLQMEYKKLPPMYPEGLWESLKNKPVS